MMKDRIELALIRLKARRIWRRKERIEKRKKDEWSGAMVKLADKEIKEAYFSGIPYNRIQYGGKISDYKYALFVRLNHFQGIGLIDEWEDDKLGQIKITFNK